MGVDWLGWQDSNLRMPVPKTGALPLGDTPAALPDVDQEVRPYSRRKSDGNRAFAEKSVDMMHPAIRVGCRAALNVNQP